MNEYRHYRGRGRGNYQHGNNYRNQIGSNIYGNDIRRCNPNHFTPLLPFPPFRETRPRWQRPPQHNNWRGAPPLPLPPPTRHFSYVPSYSPTNASKQQTRPLSPLPGSEEARQKAIAEASARIKQQLNLAEGDGHYEECNNTDETQNNISDDCIILNDLPLQGANMLVKQDKKRKHRKSVNNTATIEELRKKILTQFTYMSKGKIQNLVNNPGSTRYDNALQHLVRDMRLHLSSELRNMYTNRDADPTNEHNKMIDHFNSIVPDLGIELVSLPDTMVAELSKILQLDVNNEIEEVTNAQEASENVLVEPEDMFKQAEKLLSSTDFLNVSFDSINTHNDDNNHFSEMANSVCARSLQNNTNSDSDLTIFNCPPPTCTIISNSNQFHENSAPLPLPLEYRQNIRFDEDSLVYDNSFFYSQQFTNKQENFTNSILFSDSCVPVVPIVPLESTENSKHNNTKNIDVTPFPHIEQEGIQQLPQQPILHQHQPPLPQQLPLPQQQSILHQQQPLLPQQPPLPQKQPLPRKQSLPQKQPLPQQQPILHQQKSPLPQQLPLPQKQPLLQQKSPLPQKQPLPQQQPLSQKQPLPQKQPLSRKQPLLQQPILHQQQPPLPQKQPLPQQHPILHQQQLTLPQQQKKEEKIFSSSSNNTKNNKNLAKNGDSTEKENLNIPLPEGPKNPEKNENLEEPEDALEETTNTATIKSVDSLRGTPVRDDSSPFSKKILQDPIYENAFKINVCSANENCQSTEQQPVTNTSEGAVTSKTTNKKNLFNFDSVWIGHHKNQTTNTELNETPSDQTTNNKLNVTSFLQDVITNNLLDLPKDNKQCEQQHSDFIDKRNKFICETSCESSKSLTDRNDESGVRPSIRTRSHSPYDFNQYSEDKMKLTKSRLSLDERIKEMMKIQETRVKPKDQDPVPPPNDAEKIARAAAAAAKVHLTKNRKKRERKLLLKRRQQSEKQKRGEREKQKEIERLKQIKKDKQKKIEINALKELLKRQQKELEKTSKIVKISASENKNNKLAVKHVDQVNVVNKTSIIEQNDDTTSITSNLLNLTAVTCNLKSSHSAPSKIPIKLISKTKSKTVKSEPNTPSINTVTIKEEPISEEESSSSSSENETETSADNLSEKNNIIHNLTKDILNPSKFTKNIRHFENIDSNLNITNKILETPIKNFKIIVETNPVNISQNDPAAPASVNKKEENEESQKNVEDTTNLELTNNKENDKCEDITETNPLMENNEGSNEENATTQTHLECTNEKNDEKDNNKTNENKDNKTNENKTNDNNSNENNKCNNDEKTTETTITKDKCEVEEETKCCDKKHNENKTSDKKNSDNKKSEVPSSSHKKTTSSSSSSSKKVDDSKKHRHGSVDRKKEESSKTSKLHKKSDSNCKHKTSDTKTSSSSSHHHHQHQHQHHSDHQSSSSSISSSKQKIISRLLDIDLQIQKLMHEKWNLYKELNITNMEQLPNDSDANSVDLLLNRSKHSKVPRISGGPETKTKETNTTPEVNVNHISTQTDHHLIEDHLQNTPQKPVNDVELNEGTPKKNKHKDHKETKKTPPPPSKNDSKNKRKEVDNKKNLRKRKVSESESSIASMNIQEAMSVEPVEQPVASDSETKKQQKLEKQDNPKTKNHKTRQTRNSVHKIEEAAGNDEKCCETNDETKNKNVVPKLKISLLSVKSKMMKHVQNRDDGVVEDEIITKPNNQSDNKIEDEDNTNNKIITKGFSKKLRSKKNVDNGVISATTVTSEPKEETVLVINTRKRTTKSKKKSSSREVIVVNLPEDKPIITESELNESQPESKQEEINENTIMRGDEEIHITKRKTKKENKTKIDDEIDVDVNKKSVNEKKGTMRKRCERRNSRNRSATPSSSSSIIESKIETIELKAEVVTVPVGKRSRKRKTNTEISDVENKKSKLTSVEPEMPVVSSNSNKVISDDEVENLLGFNVDNNKEDVLTKTAAAAVAVLSNDDTNIQTPKMESKPEREETISTNVVDADANLNADADANVNADADADAEIQTNNNIQIEADNEDDIEIEQKRKQIKHNRKLNKIVTDSVSTDSVDNIYIEDDVNVTSYDKLVKTCFVQLERINIKLNAEEETQNENGAEPLNIDELNNDLVDSALISDENLNDILFNEIENEIDFNILNEGKSDLDKIIESPTQKELDVIDENGMYCMGHQKSILDIKIVGDEFFAASEDGTIYKYCLKSGTLQDAYTGHKRAVTCIYTINGSFLNIDSTLLYSGSLDCSLKCYNIETAEVLHSVTVAQAIQCLDSAWGYIFLGTYEGLLFIYNMKKKILSEHSLTIANATVLMIKATQEGSRQVLILASRKREIMVRDAFTGLLLRTMCEEQKPTIYSLLLDRSMVYCGTSDKGILILDFNNGQQVGVYNSGKGVVCMLMYRSLLFAGCYDGLIYVYNTKTQTHVSTIPGPGEGMLLSLAICKDVIVAGSKKDHLLKIWKIPQEIFNQIEL